MDALDQGVSIRDVYLNVFQPVMYEIGRLWQTGEVSVGQEHYCTNATQVTISMLYPRLFSGVSRGKRMLAACVQGELHELGLRMVSDFFEMEGWNTEYLGANTPQDSVVQAVEEKTADVLAIGVTMHFHLEKAQKMIEAVRRANCAGKVKILLGGYPFRVDAALWQTLGADGCADNAHEAIVLAQKLATEETAPPSENGAPANPLKPVSSDSLAIFDAQLASVEDEVLRQCLSEDNPQRAMGPEAESMVRNGLGFMSKMLRSTMAYGADKIIADELAWSKTALPGRGVSMPMLLRNFERYDVALKNRLPSAAYEEVRPYLASMIKPPRSHGKGYL